MKTTQTTDLTGRCEIQRAGFRVSMKGGGLILHPDGHAIEGWEKENVCRMLNEHAALVAVAEAAQAVADDQCAKNWIQLENAQAQLSAVRNPNRA